MSSSIASTQDYAHTILINPNPSPPPHQEGHTHPPPPPPTPLTQMFNVLVAADMHGNKLNYELAFPAQPTVAELQKRIEHVFGNESRLRRPASVPSTPFMIQRLQVYVDHTDSWANLATGTQLLQMCQVYAFQPESAYHREVQSKLPPAVKAPVIPQTPIGSISSPMSPLLTPPMMDVTPSMPAPLQLQSSVHSPTRPLVALHEGPLDDRLRMVFEEIDAKQTGHAQLDDFSALLRTLEVDLPVGVTVFNLFSKDANFDQSIITYAEFVHFGKLYPTLIDALFGRCREFWVGIRQREGLNAATVLMETLKSRHSDASLEAVQATSNTNQKEIRLNEIQADLGRTDTKEREAEEQLSRLRQDTLRASEGFSQQAEEVSRAVEQQKNAEMSHIEALRSIEQSRTALAVQEAETQRADEKVRELERMLRETMLEVETHRQAENARRIDLTHAEAREQQALHTKLELEKVTAEHSARLGDMEGAVAITQEREIEADMLCQRARTQTASARVIAEAEERELQMVRNKEATTRVAEAEALRAISTQEEMMRSLEEESHLHALQVRKMAAEEQPLIDAELQLRAQRSVLDLREAQLRSEHTSFQQRNGSRMSILSAQG